MLEFGLPLAFLLFLPWLAVAWRLFRHAPHRAILFSATHHLPPARPSTRSLAATVAPGLFLAGLAAGILAMARPRTPLATVRDTRQSIAIQMVLDVSGSMEALDLSEKTVAGMRYQTRLDVVKTMFDAFVSQRPNDLVGLVTFGGYASTRAPLTLDHAVLRHVLSGVDIPRQQVGANGQILNQEEMLTAIGDALATAAARMEKTPAKSRIMVLLSDGESNTGIIQPEAAIGIARQMGIRVYTIGIGTTGQAPYRVRDMFGREVIQWAQVSLDEALLKRIATETQGRYFNVRDPNGLSAALADIDRLEKTEIDQNVFHRYDERFTGFLIAALILIVLATGLNVWATGRIA